MRGLPGSPVTPDRQGSTRSDVIRDRDSEEAMILFDKTYCCPVCENDFTAKTIRSGKAARTGTDIDLRVRYKNIDPRKYRVIECPRCAYAAFDTDFPGLLKHELAEIQKQDLSGAKVIQRGEAVIGYDEAYRLYRSAFRWSMVKHAQHSERANILLHTAWLLRGWRAENIKRGLEETEPATEAEESKYLKHALQYFDQARMTEEYPIRGMDRSSLDYLMAAMCYETGDLMQARRFLGAVITDRNANRQIKTLARDLKEML